MNNEVQEVIRILNVMRWENEKSKGTRVSIVLVEQLQDTKNFKGNAVIDQFYDDTDIFDRLVNEDVFGVDLVGHFVPRPQKNNPLKINSILSSVENEDVVINLL